MVSQYWWETAKILIKDLADMEYKEEGGLYRANIEQIRRFLLYLAITYWGINPYLKELHLNLYSWRTFRDN